MQSARGPNTLNMMNYMHGEEDDQEYQEQGVSSRPNIDPKAIQDQFDNFVKEMQKYDQILSEVAKNIEQVDGQGEFITDFYPKFIWQSTYEEDQQKKIITNTDPELAKIILNLQRSNKVLKDDMRAWVLQFAKTAKNTEILIKENKILRQSIVLKNKEIVKLIEGIGQAQNEQITELTENLQLLKEQNGVLKEHLLKLKEQVTEKKQQEERIQNALEKLQNQYNRLQKTKNQVEDEEQHLSKTFELVQQWRNETQKRKRKLEKEKQNLLQKKIEYQDEKERIQRQLQLCSKQKRQLETGLKKQCYDQQAEKYRLIHEITDLGDMISKHKEESRYFQEQANRNLSKKVQYEKITKEYVKKVQQGEQKLKLLQNQLQKSQQMQVAIQCQIQLQKYDVDILKKELAELEEKEKSIHEEWKRINKRNQETRNKQISEWQSKVIQNQRELAMKILQEKSELSSKQKQLQRWQQKVYDKKEELTDLKAQMKEIKDNQVRLAELKTKLASQQAR